MTEPTDFVVRIWGARGSLSGVSTSTNTFGNETCCVEMRCGQHVLVFDMGSGISGLGDALLADGVKQANVFFSHCHYDHIIGLPFFMPLYSSGFKAQIWAGHFLDSMTCRNMVEAFMRTPFFPVTPDCFKADVVYRNFRPPVRVQPVPGVSVETIRLNHPGGSVGYRVNYAGHSVCYITDHEHTPGQPNESLIEFVRDADVMIYDATFSDEEFSDYIGYGHSTWQEGARLAEIAGVERYVVFHHRHDAKDDDLERIGVELSRNHPNAEVGRVGLELVLPVQVGNVYDLMPRSQI